MLNFPKAFVDNMKSILGESSANFFDALNMPEQKAIYVNLSKILLNEFKAVADFDIDPISYEKNGFYVDNIKRGRHPLHHAGAFYIQEPSAMFTVNAVDFIGDEYVLDMCAAPGGKSIQIANRIQKGVLVSNEVNLSRAQVLNSNIERMGLKNVIITNDTPQNLAKAYANCFDVALVDAPCSGEGMFRRGQEVIDSWNENLPTLCAKRQAEILECADACLKTGGKLIYSTCTYEIKENEEVIKNFIKLHNYKLVNIHAPFSRGINLPEAVRLYPHQVKGEGQFVCVLEKLEDNNLTCNSTLKLQQDKVAAQFISQNLTENVNGYIYNDNIYYINKPELIKKGVNYLNPGVLLGRVEKQRFVPHHQFFSAFGNSFINQLNLQIDDARVAKYLIGDQIETPFKAGYGVVKLAGCPLGGFKISDGQFKNYYPKGLRNLKNL